MRDYRLSYLERYPVNVFTFYTYYRLFGTGTVDKMRKIGYNESSDLKQFKAYKSRLGDDAPKSFEDFQKLKYDNPTAYNDLCGQYAYKGRVPEATKADYKAYKAIRSTGIYGTVRVPPEQIDTSALVFDTEHITKRGHNVNFDEAKSYIENAIFTLKRTIGTGTDSIVFINYYADDGAAYVNVKGKTIRTAFKRAEFDTKTTSAVEAAKNAR